MKTKATLIAALAVSIFSLFLAGCQEEQTATVAAETPDEVRRHRIIATENIQLREQIAQNDAQIAELKDQLAKCEDEKQAWQKRADEEIKENVEGILGHAMERTAQLQQENAELKAEIERLKQSQ